MKKMVSILTIGFIFFFATNSFSEDPRLVIEIGGEQHATRSQPSELPAFPLFVLK